MSKLEEILAIMKKWILLAIAPHANNIPNLISLNYSWPRYFFAS
jgi:hypothetical protein